MQVLGLISGPFGVLLRNNFIYFFLKFKEHELIQNLFPVLFFGPSLNTWPKCPPHLLHTISVLLIPMLVSVMNFTAPGIES